MAEPSEEPEYGELEHQSFNDDADFLVTPQLPSLTNLFTSRTASDSDVFVLQALAGKGSSLDPEPLVGSPKAQAGELDALSFAMGALWELAAENDVNQARVRGAARLEVEALTTRIPPPRTRTLSGRRAPSRCSCECCRAGTRTTCCRPQVSQAADAGWRTPA